MSEFRQVCAWCGVETSPGAEPASHGICAPCSERWELQGEPLEELHERLASLALDVEALSAATGPAVRGELERVVAEIATIHAELLRRVAETTTIK